MSTPSAGGTPRVQLNGIERGTAALAQGGLCLHTVGHTGS
jgi:hypothetical protein